jgi:hypothetical protein
MAGLSIRELTRWMIPRMTMAGCNITDIEGTLKNITSNDMWPVEWGKTAKKYLEIAQAAEEEGHKHTAYEMYFYAMLYYYEGQKVLFEDTDRKLELFNEMMDVYQKVIEFTPYPVEKVEIPYKDMNIPGYLHKPEGKGPFPCLLFIQGMDSSKEEWHKWGRYAVERGFALLCVDTPGHGETRILNNIYLDIPNLKESASVCREYLQNREDIISDKIGILGNCLGSNYGFQSAGYDKEFACCLIILSISEFRTKVNDNSDVPKWFIDMIRFFTGDSAGNEGAFEKYQQDFNLDNMENRVQCPTHLFHPEEDNWLDWGQVERMASFVEGDLKITPVEGEPVFEGNSMSHLVPIYEQIHWVLPVAFDWVQEQLA